MFGAIRKKYQDYQRMKSWSATHKVLADMAEQALRTKAARQVHDLAVRISADSSSTYSYRISVSNNGRKTYRNLRVAYRNILLFADNFSVDVTHMPEEMRYADGAPLVLPVLGPGQTIEELRTGWGEHDRYDMRRAREAALEFESDDEVPGPEDKRYCLVTVDLPNAR